MAGHKIDSPLRPWMTELVSLVRGGMELQAACRHYRVSLQSVEKYKAAVPTFAQALAAAEKKR